MVNQNSEPDFAIIGTGVARVIADRLGAAVRRAGIDDMRASFGFVIRALAERERTLTELAELIGIEQPTLGRVLESLEKDGLIERVPGPNDRRAKVIRLTDRAHTVRKAALAESRRIEKELRGDLGDADVDTMRRVLLHLLHRSGLLADAAAGRSRAVW